MLRLMKHAGCLFTAPRHLPLSCCLWPAQIRQHQAHASSPHSHGTIAAAALTARASWAQACTAAPWRTGMSKRCANVPVLHASTAATFHPMSTDTGTPKRSRSTMNAPSKDSSRLAGGPGGSADSSNSNGSKEPASWQYLVALMTLSVVICYADRSNISTAMIPMAHDFGWDKAFQGVILSAFFGGYAATQVLGGTLADKYGGKRVLATGVALWSLFTFLTPQAASGGVATLLAARVMLGVGEGIAFPSIHSLISRNVPASSQSSAVGIVTAASYAGTALAFGVSPLLIDQLGWPPVFYLFGASAVLWLPFWLLVQPRSQLPGGADTVARGSSSDASAGTDADSQEDAPLLPKQQRSDSNAQSNVVGPSNSSRRISSDSTVVAEVVSQDGAQEADSGFWALMKCRQVWAICACQYAQSYGMYGLLNWLPTFFSDYYKVELADLGGYTLLPYIVQGAVGAGAGVLADSLISRGWSKRKVRVTLQTAGMLGPASCLLLAVSPVVGGSATVASGLITVGLGLSALTLGGVSVSHLDIAPNNAGKIFGAGNTAATLAGLVSVPLTGVLLEQTESWPLVFGLIAGHMVVGSALWAAWLGDAPLPQDGASGVQKQAAAGSSGGV